MAGRIVFAGATPQLECLCWPADGCPEEYIDIDLFMTEPIYTVRQLYALPVEVPPVPDEWWITGGFQDIVIQWEYCEQALREVRHFSSLANHLNVLCNV
jgi:hypothetical protein